MRRAVRILAVAGALALLAPAPALLPALLASETACASAAGAGHAALVVDTGSQTLRLCVTLDSATVSGLHLIELAHAQHGLQYAFGFGGLAVCKLAGVGPSGSDCFGAYPDFWGMWIGDGSGGWTWSGSGAGSVMVKDGGIQAWTWGQGDNGATHRMPPRTSEASVCGASVPTHSGAPPARTTPPAPASPAPGAKAPASPKKSRAPTIAPASTADAPPDPSANPESVAADGPRDRPGPGLPAGILAVGGVLVLGLAGWMRLRSASRGNAGAEH